MTLRIMLLGLVASMGLELPSGPEVSCWTMSGRDWVQARLADLSGSVVEADRPDTGPTGCHQAESSVAIEPPASPCERKTCDDAGFLAASDEMAAEFASDLTTMQDEPSPIEPPAIRLADSEEPSCMVAESVADLDDVFATQDVPDEAMAETNDAPDRADRVSTAIRLTRDAVQAWANVIEGSSAEDCSAH